MISHPLYDAWRITPPCQLKERDCHIECPYYHECFGDYPDDDECFDDECFGEDPDDDECLTTVGTEMTVQELLESYKTTLTTKERKHE